MQRKKRRARRPSKPGSAAGEIPEAPAATGRSFGKPVVAVATIALAGAVLFFATSDRRPSDEPPALESTLWEQAGYVEPTACRDCHADIWETYAQTGMGRAFYRPSVERLSDAHEQSTPFYHEASERYYQIVERGGEYFQTRWQIGFAGEKTNLIEKRIDFVMGSGNHARTFLHQSPAGKILQLPLGWYAENGGMWAMNPGYDRPDHQGFQRPIAYDCMFCHNGYPDLPVGADVVGRTPVYEGRVPEGIDCQRCHGPGREHVELLKEGDPLAEEIRSSIVNPARLSPEGQLEVCFQCHLETTSRPLPNVTHRYDRAFFSFRPGEPLADYALYFDHQSGEGWDDKFEINHAAYRLRQSACFQQSAGAMTCTTCHDPHEAFQGEEAAARYTAVCRQCHEDSLNSLVTTGRHTGADDCLNCHMPKRRTQDVVHAVMTDHRISRRKSSGDLLEPLPEANRLSEVSYQGEVTLYYPERSALAEADELYLATAQVMQRSNLEAGIDRLDEAVRQHQPARAEFYFELGEAYRKAGRPADAVPLFEQALRRKPDFAFAQRRLGEALAAAGEDVRAEKELRKAAAMTPADADALRELGLLYARQGRFNEALETTDAALRIDDEMPALHNTRGGALAKLGQADEAQAAYRKALRLQPDLAEAAYNLGNLLAAAGNLEEAEFQWRRAIGQDPANALARYNYAVLLAQHDRLAEAEALLREAVAAQPDLAPAQTLLGDLLAASGKSREALPHYAKSVESDPDSVDARWGLAVARLSQGDAARARHDIEAVLALDPNHFDAHLALGQLLIAQGERIEGAAHLERAASSPDAATRQAARAALP